MKGNFIIKIIVQIISKNLKKMIKIKNIKNNNFHLNNFKMITIIKMKRKYVHLKISKKIIKIIKILNQ